MKTVLSSLRRTSAISVLAVSLFAAGCSSVTEPATPANTTVAKVAPPLSNTQPGGAEPAKGGALISIDPNGPADTVRVFYKNLREKRFRDAIFLTNLRPAFEGLTDAELQEFAVDFAALAGQIPAEIAINGEIIAGGNATVTANLPGKDDQLETQTIKLKKAGEVWVIQTADEKTSKGIMKEGKRYLYELRIKTHENEARKMLERISKAEMANAFQTGGAVAGIDDLVLAGLLPEDVRTSASTGYIFNLKISPDNRSYSATATPAEYGKSGRLSFILKPDGKGMGKVSSRDINGKQLEN